MTPPKYGLCDAHTVAEMNVPLRFTANPFENFRRIGFRQQIINLIQPISLFFQRTFDRIQFRFRVLCS